MVGVKLQYRRLEEITYVHFTHKFTMKPYAFNVGFFTNAIGKTLRLWYCTVKLV